MSIATQIEMPVVARTLARPPRLVRRRKGKLGILIAGRVLTAPMVGLAAFLLTFVIFEPMVAFVLPAQSARIIKKWRDFTPRHGFTEYLEYRFDASGFVGCDEALATEWAKLEVGQTVKAHVIRFGQLGYSVLDRSVRDYAKKRLIVWFAAVFAIAIGSVLFHAIWLAPWRSRWLAIHGEATWGAVVGKSIIHAGRRHLTCTLTYQFKAAGELRKANLRVSPQRYDQAPLSELVIILFDPNRPSRSMIYEYGDYIATRRVG